MRYAWTQPMCIRQKKQLKYMTVCYQTDIIVLYESPWLHDSAAISCVRLVRVHSWFHH